MENTIDEFFRRINARDINGVSKLLSENFEFLFTREGYRLSGQDYLSILGWDVGAKARFEYVMEKKSDRNYAVSIRETNQFLELLDLGTLSAKMNFELGPDDLIWKMDYLLADDDVHKLSSVPDRLEPVISWARDNFSVEMDKISSNGQPIYTQDSARQWVELLTAWKSKKGNKD